MIEESTVEQSEGREGKESEWWEKYRKVGLATLNIDLIRKLSQHQIQRLTKQILQFQSSLQTPETQIDNLQNIPYKHSPYSFTCSQLNSTLKYIAQWQIQNLYITRKFVPEMKHTSQSRILGDSLFSFYTEGIWMDRIAHIRFTGLRKVIYRHVPVRVFPVFLHGGDMGQLQQLQLHDAQLTDLTNITSINLTNLHRLALDNNKISTLDPLLSTNLDNLRIFSLSNNRGLALPELKNLNMPNIEVINLHSNKMAGLGWVEGGKFSRLKILNLYNNYLGSIEVLSCVDTGSLELLHLGANKLTCLRTLRKMNLSSIKEINISDNLINEFESLSQLNNTGNLNIFFVKKINPFIMKPTLARLPPSVRTDWAMLFKKRKTFNQLFGIPGGAIVIPPNLSNSYLEKISPTQVLQQQLADTGRY